MFLGARDTWYILVTPNCALACRSSGDMSNTDDLLQGDQLQDKLPEREVTKIQHIGLVR